MASDFIKPDRVHTLYSDEVETKMYPLPIEKLFGVGKQTSKKLRELGNTVLVVEHDEDTMYAADEIIDIGPEAGIHGGRVIAQRNSR